MGELEGRPVRVFVVWEPVLPTDWGPPSTASLARISDARASQFWDKGRLISHRMGEHDRRSVVWDFVAVYPMGAVWSQSLPAPLYSGDPVVHVTAAARSALREALQGKRAGPQRAQ